MYISYMHRDISVAELRASLSQVLREVERGHDVVVTRSGRAVARIEPAHDVEDALRVAGLRPANKSGLVPRVKPTTLSRRGILTRQVLAERA